MTQLRFEAPLQWPTWLTPTPRASQRNDHGFPDTTLEGAIGFLDEELLGMRSGGVLFLDIEQPTVERLRKKSGSRTGACLHFKHLGKSYVIACDRWQAPEHNIYALHLAIRHLRGIERWGVAPMPMLLSGFETGAAAHAVMASPAGDHLPWMEALGLGPTATLDDAVAIYHRRAKQVSHDSHALAKLNMIIEEARAYFAGKT